MKTFIFLTLIALSSMGCTHAIKVKGGRFVAPITSDRQWGGYASLSASADTRITLVKDIGGNPPTRDYIGINEDHDVTDLLALSYLGFEAGLSPVKGLELYLDNTVLGLRWQFLNHGEGAGKWVAALQGGYASGSQGTSYDEGTSKATSEIKRIQGGLSVGYRVNENLLPYLSYLYESYNVDTNVTNSNGAFGPYADKGKHQYLALGLMKPSAGLLWAIEGNAVFIDWERAPKPKTQGVIALRLGGAW